MNFEVGQVWKDRTGKRWRIRNIFYTDPAYPIIAEELNGGQDMELTLSGNYWRGGTLSDQDLVELVEPETSAHLRSCLETVLELATKHNPDPLQKVAVQVVTDWLNKGDLDEL